MVKIDDRTATSIMRSWCIIRADVEIHVTDRIEKHEVTDLFIPLTEVQMTLIAIGRAKVIKDKHRHVQSVFIDKDGINISTEHGQSEHNCILETSVETTQKLIQSVALHYIVEKL